MSKPLRALILAAGLGMRLRPLTMHTPKCLVPIGGEPLLAWWLRKLEATNCQKVLINTHHLADEVMKFLNCWHSNNMSIQAVNEPVLLGTAGTLIANKSFFEGARGLLIHADNAMASDLDPFLRAHAQRQRGCLVTMLTFHSDSPSSCGIVEIDPEGIVRAFHEKVAKPPGNLANGAIYAFEQPLIDLISNIEPSPKDFSAEVIPMLLGRIQTWFTDQTYLDVGSPGALKQAQRIWRHRR